MQHLSGWLFVLFFIQQQLLSNTLYDMMRFSYNTNIQKAL